MGDKLDKRLRKQTEREEALAQARREGAAWMRGECARAFNMRVLRARVGLRRISSRDRQAYYSAQANVRLWEWVMERIRALPLTPDGGDAEK